MLAYPHDLLQVALKVIHERNGTEVELFRNAVELAVMSTLSHPNIVQVRSMHGSPRACPTGTLSLHSFVYMLGLLLHARCADSCMCWPPMLLSAQVLTFFTDVGVSYPTYSARMQGNVPPLILHPELPNQDTPAPDADSPGVSPRPHEQDELSEDNAAPHNADRDMLQAIGIRATEVDRLVGPAPPGKDEQDERPQRQDRVRKAVVICMEYCNAGG